MVGEAWMIAEVEQKDIPQEGYPGITVYRCPVCAEVLTRTIGEVRMASRNRYCPVCGIGLIWPGEVPCTSASG